MRKKLKQLDIMTNETTELKIDMGLIANYGNADYIDGDVVVLDGIDKVLQTDGTYRFEMIMMAYCMKGRMQYESNGETYTSKAGDVVICLPSTTWETCWCRPTTNLRLWAYRTRRHRQACR